MDIEQEILGLAGEDSDIETPSPLQEPTSSKTQTEHKNAAASSPGEGGMSSLEPWSSPDGKEGGDRANAAVSDQPRQSHKDDLRSRDRNNHSRTGAEHHSQSAERAVSAQARDAGDAGSGISQEEPMDISDDMEQTSEPDGRTRARDEQDEQRATEGGDEADSSGVDDNSRRGRNRVRRRRLGQEQEDDEAAESSADEVVIEEFIPKAKLKKKPKSHLSREAHLLVYHDDLERTNDIAELLAKQEAEARRTAELSAVQPRRGKEGENSRSKAQSERAKRRQKLGAGEAARDFLDELILGVGGRQSESDAQDSSDMDVDDREDDSVIRDENEASKELNQPATIEDLVAIQLTRSRIVRWLYTPYFKETVIGMFVRLCLGEHDGKPVYRIAEVVDVKEGVKPYQVESGAPTDIALMLKHAESEKLMLMNAISNQPFDPSEFHRLNVDVTKANLDVPKKSHVEMKRAHIRHAKAYALSEQELTDMLERKRKIRGESKSLAVQKAELLSARSIAESSSDTYEVQRLTSQIEELDRRAAEQSKSSDARLQLWAKLNERNRLRNLEDVRRAEAKRKRVPGDLSDSALISTAADIFCDEIRPWSESQRHPITPWKRIALEVPRTPWQEMAYNAPLELDLPHDTLWAHEKEKFLKETAEEFKKFEESFKRKGRRATYEGVSVVDSDNDF